MFDQIQQQLQVIYDIDTDYRVSDFVISDINLVQRLSDQAQTRETVLIHQQDDTLNLSVYLDHSLVNDMGNVDNYCQVLEGVSHFLYIIHNAAHDRAVTKLELELQAEVDKFIFMLQEHETHRDQDTARDLHRDLFEKVSFVSFTDPQDHQRYADANFYAAKLCRDLLHRHQLEPGWKTMNRELRRFYRLSLQDKLKHINTLH